MSARGKEKNTSPTSDHSHYENTRKISPISFVGKKTAEKQWS